MLEPHQLPFVLAGMVLMTLQPMLVVFSQNQEGKLDYSPVVSTLGTELLKIIISIVSLSASGDVRAQKVSAREVFRFSVPAVIYCVNNNMLFFILMYVNATTFQLLSQLKIVFTGLLFRLFLGRTLTKWQYLAIWQLTCGTATSQIPTAATTASSSIVGYLLSVISCVLSALAGIYSEKLLKENPHQSSIHWQNIQLYGWGCLFNGVGAVFTSSDALFNGDPLKGFNFWAYMVVINNALNGLAISAILKYADNIARVYAHSLAMILTMLLSVWFFGHSMTPQLTIAIAMVGASVLQYNLKEDCQTPKPELRPTRSHEAVPVQQSADTVGNVEEEMSMLKRDDNDGGRLRRDERT